MLIREYEKYFEELMRRSENYVNSCHVTGSFQRIISGELDPHFIYDYRNYAFTKSTKSLRGIIGLLKMGNYEDVFILSRTIFECYLSSRYFDENFNLETIRDMVLIPTGISEGSVIYQNGSAILRDTNEELRYTLRSPDEMSLGRDKTYYTNFYAFLCQNTHCNISQVYPFLNENANFTLESENNQELSHLSSLFVFSKMFESTVLLESVRYPNAIEEQSCVDFFTDLTHFLYQKLTLAQENYDSGNPTADKDTRALLRSMRSSLKEQLGRVEKSFVAHLEKQEVETSYEKILKPVLLESEKPSEYFEEQRKLGKLLPRYSELAKTIGLEQNPEYHPEGDVWTHTMQVLDRAAALRDKSSDPYAFMLLALTHDLGKIVTTTKDENGKIHSIGHETKLRYSRTLLEKITNRDAVRRYVLSMIPYHMKPILYAHDHSSVKATDRLFEEVPNAEDIILFSMADKGIGFEDESAKFLIGRYEDYLNRKSEEKKEK